MNDKNLCIDTKNVILYFPSCFEKIANDMLKMYERKIGKIYTTFGIDDFRKIQVNLFSDRQEFRNYIIGLRNGDEASLPKWAGGTYDNGMVNTYIEEETNHNIQLYNNRVCTISHELVHIIYWETVLGDCFDDRVIWLDEGLAVNLSGEHDRLNDESQFIEFMEQRILKIENLPNLNDLNWNNFKTAEYNGYDLCYLSVRYMMEVFSLDKLQTMIQNPKLAIEIGDTILNQAIQYYLGKYNIIYNLEKSSTKKTSRL